MADKSSLLENPLISRMYFYIITHRHIGINGYSLAKRVYGKNFHTAVKVYEGLNDLKALDLITTEKKERKNRVEQIVKPNLKEFIKILGKSRLEPTKQFTENDIKSTLKLMDKLDRIDVDAEEKRRNSQGLLSYNLKVRYLPIGLHKFLEAVDPDKKSIHTPLTAEINVMDTVATVLFYGAYAVKNNLKKRREIGFDPIYFRGLDHTTLDKYVSLQIPPLIRFIIQYG